MEKLTMNNIMTTVLVWYIFLGIAIAVGIHIKSRRAVKKGQLKENEVFPTGSKGIPYHILLVLIWPVLMFIKGKKL